MLKVKNEVNMTEGPFLKKIVVFIIPLILTGLLQCLYNAADIAVVGQFRGDIALAAVGSTSSLTNLIVGLFMGISIGAGVIVARYKGEGNPNMLRRSVHTAFGLSLIAGILVMIIGLLVSPAILRWMDTPPTVIEYSILYIRIIFLGMPALMVYNFCAAMVRSVGDTKTPLIFLAISGILNVLLNLMFVALFGMGVEGVALATIISQYFSCVLIIVYMYKNTASMQLRFKEVRLELGIIKTMLYIGIPSGIQSSLFSLSNMMLQSAVNGLGDVVMAGSTAAGSIEGFIYIAMNALYQTSLTFIGQNVGAGRYKNIKKILPLCVALVTAVGLVGSLGVLLFRDFFLGLYIPEGGLALEAGIERLWIVLPLYFLCGVMETFTGALRSMGKSITAMVIALFFACVLRIVWVKVIFPHPASLTVIFISYPITWFLAAACGLAAFMRTYKKLTLDKPR